MGDTSQRDTGTLHSPGDIVISYVCANISYRFEHEVKNFLAILYQ